MGVAEATLLITTIPFAAPEFPRSPIPDVGMHHSASLSTTATSCYGWPRSGRPLSGYTGQIPWSYSGCCIEVSENTPSETVRKGVRVASEASLPSPAERETLAPITGEKDAHVLAAALGISARFLLTLDKRRLARITDASELSLPALSPGAFITRVLPTHPAYPSLRGE
jgi:hypothetical protein